MAPPTNKCRKCAKPAALRCSRCPDVFYCCKEHQKQDWPDHKDKCKDACPNFEMRKSEEFGYFVVAARDIKINEEITSELPLVMGTGHRNQSKLHCIGCNFPDDDFMKTSSAMSDKRLGRYALADARYVTGLPTCPGCRWMACHANCPGLTDPERHAKECAMVNQGTIAAGNICLQPQILAIRALLVQNHNPEMWKIMTEMGERALKERDPNFFLQDKTRRMPADLIIKTVSPHVVDASEETAQKIFAFLDLNGIWMSEPADDSLAAIYPTASLLQQDCLPNTALNFENQPMVRCYDGRPFSGKVTIRAIKDIKKGEVLTTIRGIGEGISMVSTLIRQDDYQSHRGLLCKCARCLDPTEFGLHSGTMKCGKCPGWILPTDTSNLEEGYWKCNGSCGRKLRGKRVKEMVLKFHGQLLRFEPTEERFNDFLNQFEPYLHPKHHLLINVKSNIAGFHGRRYSKAGTRVTDMRRYNATELKKIEEMCNEVVSSLEIVGPTTMVVAKFYAETLLHGTRIKIELLKRKFDSRRLNVEDAARCVVKYATDLRRVPHIITDDKQPYWAEQAAYDERTLMAWAKRKNLKIDTN